MSNIPKNHLKNLMNLIKFRAGRVNVLIQAGSREDLNEATAKLNEAMMEYAQFYEMNCPFPVGSTK